MYTQDTKVAVYPFSRQAEGDEVVIGRADTGVFLALPPDAVEILDTLAAGETVGRAQEIYRQKYGMVPEVQELLEFLETKGFVRPGGGGAEPAAAAGQGVAANVPQQQKYHFTNIPQSLAQALFGPAALVVATLLVVLAAVAVYLEPELAPERSAMIFHHDRTVMMLCLVLLGYTTVFFHEMGHLLAARARGVSSRLGISRRMWVLVAETDMTGLWSVPKRQRYLPMLAGPLVDVTSAATMLLVLFAAERHWISLWVPIAEVLRAMTFLYLMRLLWQCFFFVRTDFYYVIASFFGCKSLMQDTEMFIQNQLRRLLAPGRPLVDQSHLPPAELRVVRAYSWVWLLGRLLALSALIFFTIPVMYRYSVIAWKAVAVGPAAGYYAFFDAVFTFFFVILPVLLGLSWWISSLVKRGRTVADAKRAYAT
jgi:hypothetical protein